MRNLFIFVFYFFHYTAYGQGRNDTEGNKILNYLIREKRTVNLSAHIDSFSLTQIKEALSRDEFIRRITRSDTLHIDTIRLTTVEKQYIFDKLQSFSSYKWTRLDMKRYGLSRFMLVDSTQQKKPDFNFIVYQIMQPILLRDNKIALAYYDYACGSLCGYGELAFLIKTNGKWQHWWTIFQFYN